MSDKGHKRSVSIVLVAALALLAAVTACGRRRGLLPQSGGSPCEVLVVGDYDGLLAAGLAKPVAGLPQPEPGLDVSVTTGSSYNQASRLARNIVLTDIDATRYDRVRIRYQKDVSAHPQMIVTVEAPSASELKASAPAIASKVRDLLLRAETNRWITGIGDSHNTALGDQICQLTGWRLLVPHDMSAVRLDKDFVWLTDNGRAAERCICLYSLPWGTDVRSGRDSIMALDMPGEAGGMHMRTASVDTMTATVVNGAPTMIYRGLWEMSGDAMGGPYVLHVTADSTARRQMVAEAFVYAPGLPKRDMMMQLEAALYTLRH